MTSSMPLMAGPAHLSKAAVSSSTGDWTWGDIHRASIELAKRLDGARAICNLCRSHLGFVVVLLAGLRQGCVQVLPPSRGNADLVASIEAQGGTVIVVDDEGLLQPEWLAHNRCVVFTPAVPATSVPDADLRWLPNWDAPWFRLYTSGTTGDPEPNVKSLAQLVRGAQSLGAAIDRELDGGFSALEAIVSSVASRHMFGLEAAVMLSLVYGIPVLDRRPLLPADVCSALDIGKANIAWVTTPVHIRALSRSGEQMPNCAVVIASTMPLDATLAARIEDQTHVPILEIYGSTETGALATRRTARELRWSMLPGVRIESGEDGAMAWGDHFDSPMPLNDQIKADGRDRFILLGRTGDLIKDRRAASLAVGSECHIAEYARSVGRGFLHACVRRSA